MRLSDFKVGDRVKLKRPNDEYWDGLIGTVSSISSEWIYFYPDVVSNENLPTRKHLKQYRTLPGAGWSPNDFEILKKEEKRTMTTITTAANTTPTINVTAALELIRLLSQWIEAGRQFTCFDLTREMRARKQTVRHTSVRELVHSLSGMDLPPFAGNEYGRFTTSFTTAAGGTDTAEVYRDVDDFKDYNPDQGQTPKVVSVVAKVTGPNQIDPIVVPAKVKSVCRVCHKESCSAVSRITPPVLAPAIGERHDVDARGRICVRNSLTRSLGMNAGDTVYLQKTANGIKLTKDAPQSPTGTLTVDRDSNVRVTRRLQLDSGVDSKQFTMSIENGAIVLTL